MDDGVDLGRLIDETRKLAAENAQFCEIHTNLNREIKRLKDEKLNLTQTNGSLSKKVKHLQAKLDGGDDIVSQMKKEEHQLTKKLRESNEAAEIEKRRRQQAEARADEIIRQKEDLENRLKLSRIEVEGLRSQNAAFSSEKDSLASRLAQVEEENSRKQNHNRTLCIELEHSNMSRNEVTDSLTSTKMELSATFEKLDLALTEIEQQKGLLRELEVLSERLKKSEGLAAERLADITSLNGKIKASELTIKDLSEEVEQANIKRDDLTKSGAEMKRELAHLEIAFQDEQRTKKELNRQILSLDGKVEKLESEIESQRKAKNEELIRFQNEEEAARKRLEHQRSMFEKTVADQEVTIKNGEAELQEILKLNQRKDAQLTDQFKKIEDLMELNTKQELSLISLKNHAGEIERKYKMVEAEKAKLQSQVQLQNGNLVAKENESENLKEQIVNCEDTRRALEDKLEVTQRKLESLSKQNRKSEQALSLLTAEQAKNITNSSQLTRKHEIAMAEKDEQFRTEITRQKNEYEGMLGELDTLRTEWQKRAKTAEANLIKAVKKCEKAEKNLKLSNTQLDEMAKYEANMQLEQLNKINLQQQQLVEQRDLFVTQLDHFEKMKKFLRTTVKEINKKKLSKTIKWSKAAAILRFRKAVIAVLAINRLSSHSSKKDDPYAYPLDCRLSNQLRSGLHRVLTQTDAIQLFSTKLLAGNIQQGFQALTDKNMRLEREKNSLREKLKSSTSFMSELEDRIKNIEKKENLPNSNNSNSNDSNASS